MLFYVLRPLSSTSSTTSSFEELDGLLYMVSHTEHVLPHDLDAAAPVTPSTWVPREPSNSKVWRQRFEQLAETPVIVFSKSYCPYSRDAKHILARYNLEPPPKIVEVDLRDDGNIIKSLLIRLTGRSTFPNVILRGKSLGGYDSLLELHESGVLEQELEKAGIQVTGNIHGID
ncbi:thioredoxin-like protein [Ramaria rubella]|nr:thioredoxin-like protein [Ramaria rubella]